MVFLKQDKRAYESLNDYERNELREKWKNWEKNFPLAHEVFHGEQEGKLERIERLVKEKP
jgi:hypothetical protein